MEIDGIGFAMQIDGLEVEIGLEMEINGLRIEIEDLEIEINGLDLEINGLATKIDGPEALLEKIKK